jgi:hypothetical protein
MAMSYNQGLEAKTDWLTDWLIVSSNMTARLRSHVIEIVVWALEH